MSQYDGTAALHACLQIMGILYRKGVLTQKEYEDIMETGVDDWEKMEQIIYNMEWVER